jgi:endonuclease I
MLGVVVIASANAGTQSGATQGSADTYYANIDTNATDDELKQALFELINIHSVYSYDDVWADFAVIDVNLPGYPCDENASHIPDVYSSYCWDIAKGEGGECGNYQREGDCFNREHIWPKSWFGGFDNGANAQTDLFELYPSDGYVNNLRGNLPLGNVDPTAITYTSTNGCRIGQCDAATGYSGKCFEVTDALKGDIARSYFYLSTAYMNQWGCCDDVGVNGSSIKPWMEGVLKDWHKQDAVDDLERRRNDVIYNQFQHNRNPFIDHPEWVHSISDF